MKLAFCIFGCDTIPKYKSEILKINETWGKACKEQTEHDIRLYFMLGEEITDLSGENYIHLPGVKNDYSSASYKQFLGLDYIAKYWNPDFVHVCGTDTYVNVPKLLQLLTSFDPTEALYIGGHGDSRTVASSSLYFHSGGPGFVISGECLKRLAPAFPSAVGHWHTIAPGLRDACDVAIAYFCNKISARTVIIPGLQFTYCNYRGYFCHNGQVNLKTLIACHKMSPTDFDAYTRLLKENNYYQSP